MNKSTPSSRAFDLFKMFHKREPLRSEIVDIDSSKTVALVIGELDGVMYTSKGDGKKYIHRFSKRARPVLAISHDGSQLYALAGAYSFTAQGIVDRSK